MLRLQLMEIHHVQCNISMVFDPVEQRCRKLRRGSPRRKDYARAAALARLPARALSDSASLVIDAFLEEGDWRGAADSGKDHDPRKQPLVPGFDDPRGGGICRVVRISGRCGGLERRRCGTRAQIPARWSCCRAASA